MAGFGDSDMAGLLAALQRDAPAGVAAGDGGWTGGERGDVQLGMSSLEDVFLRVARESEVEAARSEGRTVEVQLRSGEAVRVPIGEDATLTSPQVRPRPPRVTVPHAPPPTYYHVPSARSLAEPL